MLDKSLSTFQASVRAAARGLYLGELDNMSAADALFSAIGRGFEQAFQEGQKLCGIKANERTEEESKQLALMIGDNYQYVGRFVQWINEHSKANGGNWEMIVSRAALWVNRYEEVKARAQELSCQNKKLRWQIGVVKTEHCRTCLKLNGRIHRASLWAEKNVFPRMTNGKLKCGGFNCGCGFVETDEPATRGRFPNLP